MARFPRRILVAATLAFAGQAALVPAYGSSALGP
jgi:hypothetical protein